MEERWAEYQDSTSDFFGLTVPKKFLGEPFRVSLISAIEEVWIRGGYRDFLSNVFCLTLPKLSVGESLTVAILSGIEKVWKGGGGGVSRRSIEKFLSHSAENFRRGILFCCINFGYRKSLDKKGANIKIFRRKSFVSLCRKLSEGNSQLLHLFRVPKTFG